MHDMQAMDSSNDESLNLEALSLRLALEGMPVQAVIAAEAGVSQSTVSRALRRQIKQHSKGAIRLWNYTIERMTILARGGLPTGDERPLRKTSAPKRSRAARVPRRRADRTLVYANAEDRDRLAKVARRGLDDYLADAFDPLLVIEQLAMLRRAQDPARRRSDGNEA